MLKKPLLRSYPAPLASPRFAFRGEPAQRDKASLELYLISLRPWLFCILRSANGFCFAPFNKHLRV
jgi:hypothetical protein